MGARRWLIGCALLAGSSGVAVAAGEMDTQDLGGAQHVSGADTGRDPAASSGGDALGGNRDNAPATTSPATTGGSNGREGAHAPLDNTSPRRVNLGWQSLLPGSIQ